MFPMRVYLYLFAPFVPYPFTRSHIRKHVVHIKHFDCIIYILITQDGWKERLSAVFSNIVLVPFYRTFALLYFLVCFFFSSL